MTRVLIADDVDVSRKRLSIILSRQGYQVLEADDGDEALRIMRSEHPDLAIVDLLMPAMDGFEFARAVRDDPEIAESAILFFSSNFKVEEATPLALGLGVLRVISKSCTPAQLLDAVREATTGQPAHNAMLEPLEFHRQHARLITSKLTEQMKEFVAELGNFLSVEEVPSTPSPEVLPDRSAGPGGGDLEWDARAG